MAHRYFIKMAFDGSKYHGWQQQSNAMSIEQIINKALNTALRQEVKLTGCGRTDAGVHAREYVAHFDSDKVIHSPQKLVYNLNGLLPSDIAVHQVFPVGPEAHARFSAVKRTYHYIINNRRDPFNKNFEYFFCAAPDKNLMNSACAVLMEYDDFSCFTKTHTQVNNYLCHIYEARWDMIDNRYIFTISANRFLRNMVRAIVGTMLEIGLHKITLEEFRRIIENGSRSEAGRSVPAQGLFLTKVEYPDDIVILD